MNANYKFMAIVMAVGGGPTSLTEFEPEDMHQVKMSFIPIKYSKKRHSDWRK